MAVRHDNPLFEIDKTLSAYRGDDDYELLEVITKAATSPALTTGSEWLSVVVQTIVSQWDLQLAPVSAFGQLRAATLALQSPAGGLLKVPGRDATPRINGSFVGEAAPIPARRFNFTSTTLLPHKMAVISHITRELAKASPLDVEAIIKTEILADTAIALDSVLLDATAADAIRPAGLRNGVSGLTPSAATNYLEKIAADIRSLVGAVQPARRVGILCNPVQTAGVALALPVNAQAAGIIIMPSASVTAGTVIAVDLDAFVSASGLPEFSVSELATFHEEDTTPLAISTPGAPATIAAPVRSTFQTYTVSIRTLLDVTWQMRRANATAWISGVLW